ncbi:hypothetical protein ID866_13279, partial [Astraeus odoratus]
HGPTKSPIVFLLRSDVWTEQLKYAMLGGSGLLALLQRE